MYEEIIKDIKLPALTNLKKTVNEFGEAQLDVRFKEHLIATITQNKGRFYPYSIFNCDFNLKGIKTVMGCYPKYNIPAPLAIEPQSITRYWIESIIFTFSLYESENLGSPISINEYLLGLKNFNDLVKHYNSIGINYTIKRFGFLYKAEVNFNNKSYLMG